MLDKDIILHNAKKINQLDRKKCQLQIANVFNIGLCLIVGILFATANYFGFIYGKLYFWVSILQILLMVTYLLVWGWSLFSLYTKIKASRKLLPKKKVFQLHATLLILYLLFYAIYITFLYSTMLKKNLERAHVKIFLGIAYTSIIVCRILGQTTYYLVIKMMLPLTDGQRMRKIELH